MKKKYIYGFFTLIVALFITACSNSDDYVSNLTGDKLAEQIYAEPFSESLGAFTTVSASGNQKWVYDSKGYAYMTGYVDTNGDGKADTNFPNEAWLISPTIDLTNVKTAHFSFDHVTRYFANLTSEATVWISENYTDGSFSTATWTQVPTNLFIDNGTWDFNNSGEISLTKYAGKKVRIAFKYVSTAAKAGTWEIKNFNVYTGEAVVVNYNYGDGTEDVPYTVLGASVNQTNVKGWVKGYIIGYIWYANGNNSYYFGADTCTQKTNLMLAGKLGNTYVSSSLAVQLPTGAVRNGLNLVDHKTLIGKQVTLYGDLTSYFGLAGLKNVSYYKLEDGSTGGLKPFDPSKAIYYETFAASLGKFTQYSISGTPVWGWSSSYKCAIINGYLSGVRNVNDDWLISPAVNIPADKKNATVSFEMAGKYFYGSITKNCTLFISTDYQTGSPATANWTQLTIPTYDTSDNFTFTNTEDIDISKYAGNANVRIAIKYTSDGTTTGTGQLEIRNFMVK